MQLTAIVALLALVIGFAINATGFDVKNVNLTNHNIWILQKVDPKKKNQDDGRYARVNTRVNELGQKNAVKKPTDILQSESGSLLFNKEPAFINISSTSPVDFNSDTEGVVNLASSTISSDINSSVAAIVDSSKTLRVSSFNGTQFPPPTEVKNPKGVSKTFSYESVAVTSDGQVFVFASNDGSIRKYDSVKQVWTDFKETVTGATAGSYQMAIVGDRWVLLNVDSSKLWVQGSVDSTKVASGSYLQKSGTGSNVYLSSLAGLQVFDVNARQLATSVRVPGAQETARPVEFNGTVFAAWLSADKGWFFDSSRGDLQDLPFNGKTLDSQQLLKPTTDLNLVSNGESAVVNETYSGWAWSLPTGELVSGSQNWDGDPPPVQNCTSNCPPPDQMPPRPVDDNFGVRAGQLISLPVLINDSDTNFGDIITIDPESVKGLDPGFGEARVSSNQQMITIDVRANAQGTATFKYQLTDGVSPRPSRAAKVTLHIVGEKKNSAPGWCTDVVPTCIQELPTVKVEPGSEVTVPFLDAWVDPEGDRFFISDASITSGEGNVAFSAGGDVIYQNENSGTTTSSSVNIKVVVSDVFGATTKKDLRISILPKRGATLNVPVIVSGIDEAAKVDFSKYVTGSAGQVSIAALVANEANKNSGLNIEQTNDSSALISSNKVGPAILDLTLNDSNQNKLSTTVRVNFVDPASSELSTSPVTVLVSPGLDVSVNLFTAAHNPAGRALAVSGLSAIAVKGGSISADKISGGYLRIRGRTAQDSPGYVGVVRYKLSDGSNGSAYTTTGEIYVYEMGDPDSKPPVAMQDSVTVRSNDSATVDVLANDVGNPGVPLSIDSKSLKQNAKDSCIKDGLIFAGGGKIRIVAPPKAGLYSCSYSIFPSTNPQVKSLATISIRVIAATESNQAPIPVTLFSRVRAGETVNIPVPVAGLDPDGDQVTVQSLAGIKGQKGAAYINPNRASLDYSAVAGAKGQDTFSYVLVDSKGAISQKGKVKIAILDSEPDTAPVTMNDYAEVLVGATNKVVLDPVSNDFDPQADSKNPISLVRGSVRPDVPKQSRNYGTWAKQISSVNGNKVTIEAGTEPATMRFSYRAKGSNGSTSIGYITVRATKSVLDDAPDVTDTFVTQTQQREQLTTSGIDVVSDKILWTSGDVNKLTLSVWGGNDGFKVLSNSSLTSAVIPKNAQNIIFKLSGTNFYGKEVESFGFLHLPGLDPQITFDPAKSLVKVQEGASQTFDIAAAVNLAGQISVGKVSAHGIRTNAECRVQSGSVIEYSAGAGAPWTDFCDVEIKVTGTKDAMTTIMVPIKVIPKEPEPDLVDRQITIVPGDENAQKTDLKSMTIWEGKTEADKDSLNYVVEGGSDLFKITRQGTVLTISAYGTDQAGAIRKVKVSISNHPNTKPVNLVLIVGEIPNNLPIGATLALECSVNDSQGSCQKTSNDLNTGPGVYNPFSTALTYAPFGYTAGPVDYKAGNDVICGDVKLRTTPDAITARWSQSDGRKASGSKCTIVYHVLDQTGRLGTGVLEFTFKGVPGVVRALSQVGYSASSVTIQIVSPASAFPAVDNFEVIQDNGQPFSCPIEDGATITRCVIRNLKPYDGTTKSSLHKYSVRAANAVGVSNMPRILEGAYAFRPPKALTENNIRAVTKYDPAATTSVGFAEVTIYPVADPSVKSYSVSSDVVGSQVDLVVTDPSKPQKVSVAARPGLKSTIRVSATGDVKPPVGTVADAGSSAEWVGRIAGVPKVASVTAKTLKSGSRWLSKLSVASSNRNFSNKPSLASFILYTGSTKPRCDWDPTSNAITVTNVNGGSSLVEHGEYTNYEQQIEDLLSPEIAIEDNTSYTPMVCYTNGFGIATVAGKSLSTLSDPADGQFKYAVNPEPSPDGTWLVALTSAVSSPGVYAQFNGSKTDSSDWRNVIYSTYFGEEPIIKVRYCKLGTTVCSPGNRLVTASDTTRAWQLKITKIDSLIDVATGLEITQCVRLKEIDFKLSGNGLTSSAGTQLWQAVEGSSYVTSTGAVGLLERPGDNWRLPRSAQNVTKLVMKFQGRDANSTPHVSGLTGSVTLEFSCH